ncbi:MAG: BLUF domain-containing protein [Alphaproteobacteria bacterium]
MTDKLYTIAFTTRNLIPVEDIADEMHSIIEKACKNNQKRNITGALLLSEGVFLHILEGEHDALYELMGEINKDTRHDDGQLLLEKPIAERGFEGYRMEYYNLQDPKKISLERLQLLSKGIQTNKLYKDPVILKFYNAIIQ